MSEHPVHWTAHLKCGHETSTQGRPSEGSWISCRSCQNQQRIGRVSPVLHGVPAGWVQEPLPFAAAEEAA